MRAVSKRALRTLAWSGWGRRCQAAASITILVSGACATSPPDYEAAEYRRVDRQQLAIERFDALERSCRAAGGTVRLDRSWGRFPPALSDLRMASCAASPRLRR